VDIFSKTYLCIPAHKDGHWSALILCHPAAHTMQHGSGTGPGTPAATKPVLLHVDSMLVGHDTKKTAEQLYPYMQKEWSRLVS
jgi:Ulp1 family protease